LYSCACFQLYAFVPPYNLQPSYLASHLPSEVSGLCYAVVTKKFEALWSDPLIQVIETLS
jgi:hypothetical protein